MEKTFLGKTGTFDGHDVIDIIMRQQATYDFFARKLWSCFAYADPEPGVVRALGNAFKFWSWNIAPALRRMFLSRAFYSEKAMGTRIKSPTELLVGTWRRLGLTKIPQPRYLKQESSEMGQVVLQPPTVEGWPGGREWITSSTLLARYNYLGRLLLSKELDGDRFAIEIPPALAWAPLASIQGPQEAPISVTRWIQEAGATDAAAATKVLVSRFLMVPLSEDKQAGVVKYLEDEGWNPSHEKSERLLRRALHLILCTPEYQVH